MTTLVVATQSGYLAAAGVLLVLGHERLLLAVLTPVAAGGTALLWWEPGPCSGPGCRCCRSSVRSPRPAGAARHPQGPGPGRGAGATRPGLCRPCPTGCSDWPPGRWCSWQAGTIPGR
ncbi:hypothetical protein NKH18_42725 [Streptomyces sp. M10(2022)]